VSDEESSSELSLSSEVGGDSVTNSSDEADKSGSGASVQMQWYVIQAYSGFEAKVKQLLEDRARRNGLEHLFGQIVIPQETITELVKGEKKEIKKKFFPGYVIVQMALNEDSWHLVKETPKVSGFVGGELELPEPLSEAEVKRILSQVEHGSVGVVGKGKSQFEQGDMVVVKDGPFLDFKGTVEEVRPEKSKVRVLISIFGRNTPIELDFVQVEKC
jgi:transcriptional antiterminator NusG